MRKDMSKVVTERPRRGHANKSNKTGRKLTSAEFEKDDVGPARAPVSRFRQYGSDAKDFSDLIGPLRRSLRKNVGRPWNKVKSELSKTLDRTSMSGRHIWSHIEWEVSEDCFMGEDEKVYARRRWGSPKVATDLYVHPITGLLCWKPRKRLRRPILEKPLELIQIDENNALTRIDGIWYHLGPARQNDAGTELVRPKRQLSRKELAKHGLTNSAVEGEKPDKQERPGALAGGRPRVRKRP
jgi:hypothetical protein